VKRPQGFEPGTRPRHDEAATEHEIRTAQHGHIRDELAVPVTARGARIHARSAARARRRVEADELRRFTRRSRRRRAVVLGAVAAVVLVIGVPLLLAVSPAFAVRHLRIQGGDAAVTAAVRGRLAGDLGTPIALVDLSAVRSAIAAVPQVQSYAVASLPPDTLQISLVQRTPVAVVGAAGDYRLVDAAGVVLATTATRPAGYPLVHVTATGAAAAPAFTAAAAVVKALPPALLAKVDSVTASGPDAVVLTLTGTQQVAWGSADDSAEKAEALTAALLHAAKHAKHIDVSAPGLVSVR
jgi:cell division protein FtsQ